jgi:hypothetical protein
MDKLLKRLSGKDHQVQRFSGAFAYRKHEPPGHGKSFFCALRRGEPPAKAMGSRSGRLLGTGSQDLKAKEGNPRH